MQEQKLETCCFSGYRIEKMPFLPNDTAAIDALCSALTQAIATAAAQGYTRFVSGMSTGLDLWAAEAVLRLRDRLPVQLVCAVPFDQQAEHFPTVWKRIFNRCLLQADQVYSLSRRYYSGCYAARNQFMVDQSSLLICYYDGRPGGTAQTVRMARQAGLDIVNLAERQLSFAE